MPDYEFFDVSVILGKPRLRAYHDCSDASRMRDDLAGFGITGGLVQHTMQEDVGPGDGNEVLVEALHGTTGFEPLLAVMPHWTGEFAEPPFVLDKMRERRRCGGGFSMCLNPSRRLFFFRSRVSTWRRCGCWPRRIHRCRLYLGA